jgi:hypothetical protein
MLLIVLDIPTSKGMRQAPGTPRHGSRRTNTGYIPNGIPYRQ